MFDWLKNLFTWKVPAIPSPFTWVSDFVDEWVQKRTYRIFIEILNGISLIASVLGDEWGKRDWIVGRLKAKLVHAVNTGWIWAKGKAKEVYDDAKNLVAEVWDYIDGQITPWLTLLTTTLITLTTWLHSWIETVYTPFVAAYHLWKTKIDSFYDRFVKFTDDMVNYWVGIYNSYKFRLVLFLDNPATFIVAWLIDKVNYIAEDLRQLASMVLDRVW